MASHDRPHPAPARWPGALVAIGLLVMAVMIIAACGLVVRDFNRQRQISRGNYSRIQLGMPQAELHVLLGGAPELEVNELGLVNGPESYTVNFDASPDKLRQRGFQQYCRQQWASPEITIIVICDSERKVVCRYEDDGQRKNWFQRIRAVVSQ